MAWISAITALVAVIVGPIISVYVVKRQISANVISVNRQQWINTLREKVSSFVNASAILTVGEQSKDEIFIRMEKLHLLISEIKLLINPKEDDHIKLIDLIDDSALLVGKRRTKKYENEEFDQNEIGKLNNKIIMQCQLILKSEWERVKSGK